MIKKLIHQKNLHLRLEEKRNTLRNKIKDKDYVLENSEQLAEEFELVLEEIDLSQRQLEQYRKDIKNFDPNVKTRFSYLINRVIEIL